MKDRGFSLFELLVVLILLSLSLALVAPSLSRFLRTVELKGAAQKVSGILRNSRSEAVNKGKVYQVLFNSQSREVSVHSMEPPEEKDERKEGPAPEKTYLLPEGIQMKGDPTSSSPSASELSQIEFYPNGGSNGGTILLDSPDRLGYRIQVHFLTGMVAIKRAK
jgi:general secretion pathway protein H